MGAANEAGLLVSHFRKIIPILSARNHGTRYLADNDPAEDPRLNPGEGVKRNPKTITPPNLKSPWRGKVGFPSITEAWNGAVFASRFGTSGAMVLFGGGHNDYFGSDVHAFDLATRCWSRILDGYVVGRANEYGAGAVYPMPCTPGSPLPPHTYGYVQYDPVGNDYLLFKGQMELGPDVRATPIPHMLNLDSLSWRRDPNIRQRFWPQVGGRHGIPCAGSCGAIQATMAMPFSVLVQMEITATAPLGGGVLPIGKRCRTPPTKRDADRSGARHPRGSRSAFNGIYAIDPSAPDREIAPLASAGDQPFITPYAAIEYAPNLDQLVYYSANDGPQIYSITAPAGSRWRYPTSDAWNWRSVLNGSNGLNPIADAQAISSHAVNKSHTFGRFRVASYDGTDVAILVRHIDTPVYAMRLN